MRAPRSRSEIHAGGSSPSVRARYACVTVPPPETSNRTLVTRTESGAAGIGWRGSTLRRPTWASISGRAARAAASPRAISSPARPNPKLVKARTSGTMSTSHAARSARSESHTRNDTDCASTSTSDTIESRGSSGSVTSLQISTSAPRARASRAGRLRTTPPSIRTFGPSSTGANTLGSAMLARIASGRNPRSSTTAWPVSRSVATAANGMGSRRKSWMPCADQVSRVRSSQMRWPGTTLLGSWMPPR